MLSANDDAAVQSALRAFELLLLAECGLLPDLSLVTQTQQVVDPGAQLALLPEAGVAPAQGRRARPVGRRARRAAGRCTRQHGGAAPGLRPGAA